MMGCPCCGYIMLHAKGVCRYKVPNQLTELYKGRLSQVGLTSSSGPWKEGLRVRQSQRFPAADTLQLATKEQTACWRVGPWRGPKGSLQVLSHPQPAAGRSLSHSLREANSADSPGSSGSGSLVELPDEDALGWDPDLSL